MVPWPDSQGQVFLLAGEEGRRQEGVLILRREGKWERLERDSCIWILCEEAGARWAPLRAVLRREQN